MLTTFYNFYESLNGRTVPAIERTARPAMTMTPAHQSIFGIFGIYTHLRLHLRHVSCRINFRAGRDLNAEPYGSPTPLLTTP